MKKLGTISVKSLSVLSREDMARISGGDFTVYDCRADTIGKYCALSFIDDWMRIGVCTYAVETTGGGFVYSYYCAPKG